MRKEQGDIAKAREVEVGCHSKWESQGRTSWRKLHKAVREGAMQQSTGRVLQIRGKGL